MSSPSGVGGSSGINQHLQQLNIAEGVSDLAMDEEKKADSARRMDEAEAMRGINVPGAISDDGAIFLTSFNGPEVTSPDTHDLNKLQAFLDSDDYEKAKDGMGERVFQLSKLFSDQAELLIDLKQALSRARESQSQMSGRLSELSSEITRSFADRMVAKARDNYGQQIAGSVVGGTMAFASMAGAGKNSQQSRLETKSHHSNINQNRSSLREQQAALRDMENNGLAGTPEHQALKIRIDETEQQGQILHENHELEKSKADHRHTTYMAVQGMTTMASSTLSAGAVMTDAAGDADIARAQAARDMDDDMRRRSDQSIDAISADINDAVRSLRDIEEASTSLIGAVANKI